MLKFSKITVHCSATKPSMKTTARDIRRWHVEDNGWHDIGYHYIIDREGVKSQGRPIEEVGAHVKGHNVANIGICLIGGMSESGESEFNYTLKQLHTLKVLIDNLRCIYGFDVEVLGHNDLDPNKTCPNFNVKAWWGNE